MGKEREKVVGHNNADDVEGRGGERMGAVTALVSYVCVTLGHAFIKFRAVSDIACSLHSTSHTGDEMIHTSNDILNLILNLNVFVILFSTL